MAFLAAMTLIVGVYPDIFLVPITGYITSTFSGTPEVLQLPTTTGGGRSAGEVTNMTSSSLSSPPPPTTAQPSLSNVNGNNGESNLLLNKNPSQVNMEQQQQSLLSNYYHPNIGSKGGLYRAEVYDVGGGVGGIAKVGGGLA